MSAYQMVSRHVEAALAEAAKQSIAPDVVATNLLAEAVRILKQHRKPEDVRSALHFAIDTLEDRDWEFMRP
ncbi:hypothetical protein V6B08_11040 [Ferrovibrio sp. MS7]|uniref:hypothetical protein n=1 Tax=Ferrovibrio plantarum TaxID=3119164 RepID=UPI003135216D